MKLTKEQYDKMGFFKVWTVTGSKGSIEIGNKYSARDAILEAEVHFDLGSDLTAVLVYDYLAESRGES